MFTNDLFTLSAPASAVAPSLPILFSAKRAMFSSLAFRSDAARTSQIQFRQRRVALERDGQRLGAVVPKTIHCSRSAVSGASRSENSSQAPRLPLKSTLASAVWRSSASDSALTPTRPTLLPAQETQLQQTNTLAPRRAALINAMRATDWLRFSPSANATWPSSPS